MSSQDDPEARIRELEQSQAGQGAVELGTSGYPGAGADQTAPLPPPLDTDPYAAAPYAAPPFGVSYPPAPRKGVSVAAVFGVIAAAVVVAVVVIGVVMWNVMSERAPVATREGGPTVLADRPAAPRFDPPTIVEVIPGDDAVIIEGPIGAPLSVSGIDEIRTVACDNSIVSVSGVNNDVTITGHCVSVTVSGVDNSVSVDSADVISASGFDNQVTYATGDPQINNFGGSNTVARG